MSFLQINIGTSKENVHVFDVDNIQIYDSLKKTIKFNWDQLHEDNSLDWLIVSDMDRKSFRERLECYSDESKKSFTKKEELEASKLMDVLKNLEETFFHLMDEWFDLTKSNSNRKEYYAIMRKLIIARAKSIDDESQKNWVNKFEQDLRDLSSDVKDYTKERETVALMNVFKIHIDTKKLTVTEYHEMVQSAIDMGKEANKIANKRGKEG